jgi:hypothetical protein
VRIDKADAAHWNIPDLRGCEATSYALDRRDGVQRENGCSASSLYELIGGGAKNGNGLNLIAIQRQQRFLIAQQDNAMGGKQTSSFAMRSFRNSMGLSVVIKLGPTGSSLHIDGAAVHRSVSSSRCHL